MYTTASGVQIPQGTDSFSPTTQLKAMGDKLATYDYFTSVAQETDRAALAAPVLRDGLHCYVRATDVLWRYDGGWAVAFEYPPSVSLVKTGSQNLTAGVAAAITWQTVVHNSGGMFSAGQPTRLVAPSAGIYEVHYTAYISSASGTSSVEGRVNGSGTAVTASGTRRDGTGGSGTPLSNTFVVSLAASGYVELFATTSIASQTVGGGGIYGSAATMKRIG